MLLASFPFFFKFSISKFCKNQLKAGYARGLFFKGSYGKFDYYSEESLGPKIFTNIFAEDVKKHGRISYNIFDQFLKIVGRYAKA